MTIDFLTSPMEQGHDHDVTLIDCPPNLYACSWNALLASHHTLLVVEEGTVVNGFGAYMSANIQRLAPTVRVATHGVPDRIVYAAPRAKQLASLGLDAAGIADRVRALHESEAMAG